MYRGAEQFLARPGRKQANVCVRIAWISFRALLCRKKKTWRQLASRCCWNHARPWHASELVSFLVGLRTYQHPGICIHVKCPLFLSECNEIFNFFDSFWENNQTSNLMEICPVEAKLFIQMDRQTRIRKEGQTKRKTWRQTAVAFCSFGNGMRLKR
jgi:hypothetical protein